MPQWSLKNSYTLRIHALPFAITASLQGNSFRCFLEETTSPNIAIYQSVVAGQPNPHATLESPPTLDWNTQGIPYFKTLTSLGNERCECFEVGEDVNYMLSEQLARNDDFVINNSNLSLSLLDQTMKIFRAFNEDHGMQEITLDKRIRFITLPQNWDEIQAAR